MKFLTFAYVINFILVCWPKLDIISSVHIVFMQVLFCTKFDLNLLVSKLGM